MKNRDNIILENFRKLTNLWEGKEIISEEMLGGSDVDLESVKKLISSNKFIGHHAENITQDMVHDTGKLIYVKLPDQLDSPHMKKHFDKNNPGSVWSITPQEVDGLIVSTLNTEPTKKAQEGPVFKYKWLNIDSGKEIGYDSLIKSDSGNMSTYTDYESFGMVDRVKDWEVVSKVARENEYELVTKEGEPYTEKHLANNVPAFIKQDIGVVKGDKMDNPTKSYNLILAKIAEMNGKDVLTLMTIFPGMNPVDQSGNDITNKGDLAKHGYALLKNI